jgi:hypothetical protein
MVDRYLRRNERFSLQKASYGLEKNEKPFLSPSIS